MLAMANTAPVQEEQKNLQGLLDALTDQKTDMDSVAQAASLVKQQQDDDGSQEAEAQFLRHIVRSFWANKQQGDDGNEADVQFLRHIVRSFWANKQQGDDTADAQSFFLGKLLLKALLPHAIQHAKNRFGWALEMEQLGSWMKKFNELEHK